MKANPLLLIALAVAGLVWWKRRQASTGQSVSIGRLGSDVTQEDARGDAIAAAIQELVGDGSGTLTYSDSDIDLAYTQGLNPASDLYGPRLAPFSTSAGAFNVNSWPNADAALRESMDSGGNVWQARGEQALRDYYRAAATSPDPALRREAWLFSWSDPFDDVSAWLDKVALWFRTLILN